MITLEHKIIQCTSCTLVQLKDTSHSSEVAKLNQFLDLVHRDGKVVYVYDVLGKDNSLLQSMRPNSPDYMLVLPCHFRKEIIEREHAFLEGGGQLLFPFPSFEVYSSKPKILITGVDGQIGYHLVNTLRSSVNLYGITRGDIKSKDVQRIHSDLTDRVALESLICTIRPDQIIHLASLSNIEECETDPSVTLTVNTGVVVNLCNIIHRNRLPTKLFHASTSDLYKGHGTYTIEEDDINYRPVTMYGLCKTAAHSIVDSYRIRHGLPFSNGILFTTESKQRKPTFLLKKVALHAKAVQEGSSEPLVLGSLTSYRTITHAADVATAIQLLLAQPQGDNYLICTPNSQTTEELVLAIYKHHGILLEKRDSDFYNRETGILVVKTDRARHSRTEDCVNITGCCKKLIALGWKPSYDVAGILADMS